jgi:hypothetical protein
MPQHRNSISKRSPGLFGMGMTAPTAPIRFNEMEPDNHRSGKIAVRGIDVEGIVIDDQSRRDVIGNSVLAEVEHDQRSIGQVGTGRKSSNRATCLAPPALHRLRVFPLRVRS